MSKLIKWYTSNTCSTLYINYTSTKQFFKKRISCLRDRKKSISQDSLRKEKQAEVFCRDWPLTLWKKNIIWGIASVNNLVCTIYVVIWEAMDWVGIYFLLLLNLESLLSSRIYYLYILLFLKHFLYLHWFTFNTVIYLEHILV